MWGHGQKKTPLIEDENFTFLGRGVDFKGVVNFDGTVRIDGTMAADETFAWTQEDVDAPLIFGDLVEANPNKFDGLLDEVAFYARELSQGEIAAHIAAR